MEKAVLDVKKLNITQGMNEDFSHKGELAIDIGIACEYFKAPFTGTIKRIYEYNNTVWLESNEKVKYADGTEDYMTIMTSHDNDVSNLYVGKVIKQNEVYYAPGVKGKVTGPHIHLGVGKGKFTGNGWHKGEYQPKIDGYAWPINNQYNIVKALFLYDKVEVINGYGYNWIKTDTFVVDNITPNVERNEDMEQVEVLIPDLRVRKEPSLKGEVLGFASMGFYNVYDKKENDGYLWVKIADNQWIATNDGWTKIYPPTDYKKLYEEELEKNKELTIANNELKTLTEQLQAKITKAIEDLA